MSVLGLDSGYTAKYGLNPREFPRAAPSGTPLGSSHISPYIPPLLLIRIQYTASKGQRTKLISVDIFGGAFNDYLNPCKTTHDFLVEVNRVCSDRAWALAKSPPEPWLLLLSPGSSSCPLTDKKDLRVKFMMLLKGCRLGCFRKPTFHKRQKT